MPLMVTVHELQPGMRLSEAFRFRGRMMLPGGKVLGPPDIDILRRKYPDQTLKVGDPVLDSLAEFEDDSRERTVAHTTTQKIISCVTEFQENLGHQSDLGHLDFRSLRKNTHAAIEYLRANPVSAALIDRNAQTGGYLAQHAGNVFYLSLVLGAAVRDYVIRERQRQTAATNLSFAVAMDLLPLGVGAMLLDIGMHELQYIFEPGYVLTPADREKIRQHPHAGAAMLSGDLPPGVKTIVNLHHENYDGSGYPNGIKTLECHIFTRIVRICDAFDAGTAHKAYAQAKSPARVLWEMCAGTHKHCFDPVLTKVFSSLIQPFPIGAKLQLTDGRWGVVVRYNRQQPFCPALIIAFDAQGQRLAPDKIVGPLNVGDNNALRLAAYAGENLSFIYGTPLVEVPEDALLELAYA